MKKLHLFFPIALSLLAVTACDKKTSGAVTNYVEQADGILQKDRAKRELYPYLKALPTFLSLRNFYYVTDKVQPLTSMPDRYFLGGIKNAIKPLVGSVKVTQCPNVNFSEYDKVQGIVSINYRQFLLQYAHLIQENIDTYSLVYDLVNEKKAEKVDPVKALADGLSKSNMTMDNTNPNRRNHIEFSSETVKAILDHNRYYFERLRNQWAKKDLSAQAWLNSDYQGYTATSNLEPRVYGFVPEMIFCSDFPVELYDDVRQRLKALYERYNVVELKLE